MRPPGGGLEAREDPLEPVFEGRPVLLGLLAGPGKRKENLANWLFKRVVDKFPWWSPNLARYWGINARIIDTGFDAYRVAEWTGHSSVNRIKDHYAPRARALRKAHGDKWVLRAFQKLPGG